MDRQTETTVKNSLEAVRDALKDCQHAIKGILDRVDRIECDVDRNSNTIDSIVQANIRTEERLAIIQKAQDLMASDMRSIRNSVLTAVISAIILGIGGLALTAIRTNPTAPTVPIHSNK